MGKKGKLLCLMMSMNNVRGNIDFETRKKEYLQNLKRIKSFNLDWDIMVIDNTAIESNLIQEQIHDLARIHKSEYGYINSYKRLPLIDKSTDESLWVMLKTFLEFAKQEEYNHVGYVLLSRNVGSSNFFQRAASLIENTSLVLQSEYEILTSDRSRDKISIEVQDTFMFFNMTDFDNILSIKDSSVSVLDFIRQYKANYPERVKVLLEAGISYYRRGYKVEL